MKRVLHAGSGIVAICAIFTFLSASILADIFGSPDIVKTVKSSIVFPGLILLIPSLIIVGLSGASLAKRMSGPLIARKQRRMRTVAGVGILVLVPCATVLGHWAAAGSFGLAFQAVQLVEIAAGAINLTLLTLNLIDGLKLQKRRKAAALALGNAHL